LHEIAQFLFTQLGDGEVIHARFGPAEGVIAVLVEEPARERVGVRGPDEEVDVVFAALVDDGGDVAVVEDVEPAADEGITGGGE
jgi:hypothetical protein